MKNYYYLFSKICVFVSVLTLFSCSSLKKYKYFQDISDTARVTKIAADIYKEPIIRADDILYIAVQTLDPIAGTSINSMNFLGSGGASPLTNPVSSTSVTANQSVVYGYLVDRNGFVHIPVLGDVQLAGLTTTQAREALTVKASVYYNNNPTIIVRFANFKITVIGEVQRPGTFTISTEKVSILDALGYSGDLTIYGRRDNVLLVRQNTDGSKSNYRINLTNSEFMKSPIFYLQQGDVLYVEPLLTKVNSSDATQARNLSIITGIISLIVVYLTTRK